MSERMTSSIGQDPDEAGERARPKWIRQDEIQMDQARGRDSDGFQIRQDEIRMDRVGRDPNESRRRRFL